MSYLITQSLLGAWSYMFSCSEEFQEKAYSEFMNTLNRIPKEATKEMQNGIDFEKEVYRAAAGLPRSVHPKWENGINKVATVIQDAPVQVKAQREVSVAGLDLLVYGILDALKAGIIYDVKFSNKGFGSAELAGKYLDSPQHPTYLFLVPEAREFTYLVSDGEDLYTETYTKENSRPFEEIAREFLESLSYMNLLNVYKDKWLTQ